MRYRPVFKFIDALVYDFGATNTVSRLRAAPSHLNYYYDILLHPSIAFVLNTIIQRRRS